MTYCSSDGKFAGYGEPTVEVESEDISDSQLSASVKVVRTCASCGQEQAETTLEFEIDLNDHDCPERAEGAEPYSEEEDERTFEVTSGVEAEPVDDYQTTDRHGKPIRNPRYQRHLLGASITATVKCSRCEEEWTVSEQQTVPASAFDDQGSH